MKHRKQSHKFVAESHNVLKFTIFLGGKYANLYVKVFPLYMLLVYFLV